MDFEMTFSVSFAILFIYFMESSDIAHSACSMSHLTHVYFFEILIYISYHLGFHKFMYLLQERDWSVVMWDIDRLTNCVLIAGKVTISGTRKWK